LKHITSPSALEIHSKIVESSGKNENHSKIVETVQMGRTVDKETQSSLRSIGIFNEYPHGIFNPSFTGMILWEIKRNHILNDYKVCPYHLIKSGIILYGNEAFVFTPISNNDMKSFLKILLMKKELPNGLSPLEITKDLVQYIRGESSKTVIPCITTIQEYLYKQFQLNAKTFDADPYSFQLLLKRIYILTFMLHYQMPIQRKNFPGSRNTATTVKSHMGKGWYSYLSKKEQKILQQKYIFVSSSSIQDIIS